MGGVLKGLGVGLRGLWILAFQFRVLKRVTGLERLRVWAIEYSRSTV